MIRMQERFRDDGPGGANGDKVVSYLTFHNAPAFRILRAAPELEARLRPSLGGAQRHQLPAKRATRNQIRVIRPIGRIRLIRRIPAHPPLVEPGGGQLLRVSALLNEGLLQRGDLLIQQVVRLMDQADDGIRPHGGILMIQPGSIKRVAPQIGLIRPIGRIRPIWGATRFMLPGWIMRIPPCGRMPSSA